MLTASYVTSCASSSLLPVASHTAVPFGSIESIVDAGAIETPLLTISTKSPATLVVIVAGASGDQLRLPSALVVMSVPLTLIRRRGAGLSTRPPSGCRSTLLNISLPVV